MNIKYIKLIVSLFLFSFSFYSCEKEMRVNLRSSEACIVIEGQIQLDSFATIKITESKDYNTDNTYNTINGAIVSISDSDGNSEVLNQNTDGFYIAQNIKGVVGRTYYLSVKVEEKEYTSISTLPTPVPIDTITMYDIPALGYPFPVVVFQDPPIEKNYYRCRYYVNGKRILVEDDLIDTKDRNGFEVERILPVYEDQNDDKEIFQGDEIKVELHSIDESVYRYFEALANIENSLTNPTTNIKGGALGYFSAYAVDTMTISASW